MKQKMRRNTKTPLQYVRRCKDGRRVSTAVDYDSSISAGSDFKYICCTRSPSGLDVQELLRAGNGTAPVSFLSTACETLKNIHKERGKCLVGTHQSVLEHRFKTCATQIGGDT